MQQTVSAFNYEPAAVKGLAEIHEAIAKASWKVSGCGLSQGALSCALFIDKYARYQKIDHDVELSRELFDLGCRSLAVERSSWLELADLALVCHRFSRRRIVEADPDYFFEDIDKIAIQVVQHNGPLTGFTSARMGAALYAIRRLAAGASAFSKPVSSLTSAITLGTTTGSGPDQAGPAKGNRCSLAVGYAAPVLFAAAACELGLLDKRLPITGINWRIEQILSLFDPAVPSEFDTGWHHGDLGKAYAVLRAGMAFENKGWIGAGMDILTCCAYQVLSQGVLGLDIAGGGAGMALVFQKVYRITGQYVFKEAAGRIHWLLARTAIAVDEGNIDAGYSFNHGISGIGLAIIAGMNEQDEELDELMWLI